MLLLTMARQLERAPRDAAMEMVAGILVRSLPLHDQNVAFLRDVEIGVRKACSAI